MDVQLQLITMGIKDWFRRPEPEPEETFEQKEAKTEHFANASTTLLTVVAILCAEYKVPRVVLS